jgi:hypothetical protein
LAVAARNGRIYRNLQGYTTDETDALISLGLPPSAAGLWAERAWPVIDGRAFRLLFAVAVLPVQRGPHRGKRDLVIEGFFDGDS